MEMAPQLTITVLADPISLAPDWPSIDLVVWIRRFNKSDFPSVIDTTLNLAELVSHHEQYFQLGKNLELRFYLQKEINCTILSKIEFIYLTDSGEEPVPFPPPRHHYRSIEYATPPFAGMKVASTPNTAAGNQLASTASSSGHVQG